MVKLPTYIPLDEAAATYRLDRETLTGAVENGIIRAVKTPEGGILVAEEDAAVVAAQARATEGGDKLVSISEAARRLDLNSGIVWWWYKHGWLPEQERGSRNAILVSLKQAQILAKLREKRGKRGRRLIPKGMEVHDFLTSTT